MCGSVVAADWRQGLSPRKRQVMDAICHGLARKEIATRLGISPETIKQHTQELYLLAGVHSAKELLAHLMASRGSQLFAGLLAIATRADLYRAVLARASEMLPGARARLIAMEDLPMPARQAVSRGECWLQWMPGEVFYAPCWLPPDYAALTVNPTVAPTWDQIEQIHLLGMVAQARAVWLPPADSAIPAAQLELRVAESAVSAPRTTAPPARGDRSPAAAPPAPAPPSWNRL